LGAQDAGTLRQPRPAYERWDASVAAQDGALIVSGRREVEEILRHPEIYSSVGGPWCGHARPLRPLHLDPPAHAVWRAALDPLFAPASVEDIATTVTRLAVDLIDGFAGESEIDFAAQFSVPFPAQVFMTLLGLPPDDLAWILDLKDGVTRPHRALGKPLNDPEAIDYQNTMAAAVCEYFGDALDRREQERTDDLLSRVLDIEIDGQRVSRNHLIDVCFVLLITGIDPVSAALDCFFSCLAEHPELRHQVTTNSRPALEELLRWETPVMVVARTANTDTRLGACPISAGQRMLVLLGAANVDPVESPDAGLLRCDRKVNRHLAFGTGIHRCLGSHLARLELSVALREWHARIPVYSVNPHTELVFSPEVRTVDPFSLLLGRQACE
jgi:cytochrome P450